MHKLRSGALDDGIERDYEHVLKVELDIRVGTSFCHLLWLGRLGSSAVRLAADLSSRACVQVSAVCKIQQQHWQTPVLHQRMYI